MLKNLGKAAQSLAAECDVAIIGAGLAGLFLADRLIRSGRLVIVLESGLERQDIDVHPLNDVEMTGQLYSGASLGRARCLGGTSTRWGGALLPYQQDDLSAHPCGWHDGWGISPDELAAQLAEIERIFQVDDGSYEQAPEPGDLASFNLRRPKWPTFERRSTANLFRGNILHSPLLEVWLDSTAVRFALDGDRVTGITAQAVGGNKLEIKSACVVIAAGAIETTRLLLLLDHQNDGVTFSPESPLGSGFHDHLSAKVADLEVTDRRALVRNFGIEFSRNGMRNCRFELSAQARQAMKLPGAFVHVAFGRDEGGGFEALRHLYQSLQSRTPPALADIVNLLRETPWLLQAIWWRFANRRVWPPKDCPFELHLVTEQEPRPDNSIGLDMAKLDLFGLPKASIQWSVSDSDKSCFLQNAQLVLQEWGGSRWSHIATANALSEDAILEQFANGGGIYHPAGTTRMGATPSEGVVDRDLRVFGVSGLWAVATSVFPSIGSSSPSLALLQLAMHAASDIESVISRIEQH